MVQSATFLESGRQDGSSSEHEAKVSMACAAHSGVIEFSIDQQPYVQGYMVVEGRWLQLTNGNDMGGGSRCAPAPSMADKTNIDQILPDTQKNTR